MRCCCDRVVRDDPALQVAPDVAPVVDEELVVLQLAHRARVVLLHLPLVLAQLLPALPHLPVVRCRYYLLLSVLSTVNCRYYLQ